MDVDIDQTDPHIKDNSKLNDNDHEIPLFTKFCKNIIVDENNNKNEDHKKKIFENYVEQELLLTQLPKDIYVSTMTATCKINDLKFNCENIARYIDLSYDDIEDIVCALEESRKSHQQDEKYIIYRSLPNKKKEKKNTPKKKNVFYNQVSIHLNIKSKENDPVHIKLFTNGSIHITGCQSVNDIVETLTTIINKLQVDKACIDKTTKKIIDKPFVSEKKYLDISSIANLKVNMINTNFTVKFKINLDELYALMQHKGIECRYDKLNHSCVNIKYDHPEKKISIFVFEKGSIVITGAKNGEHIRKAYDFINKFLYANYKSIVKKEIDILEKIKKINSQNLSL
jgi:TATA-box binding protein (TBP) (component of TFIID and TFIIIB)